MGNAVDRAIAQCMSGAIDRLFNQHKVVRRSLVISGECLLWYTAIKFFSSLESIQAPHATIIVAIIGARELSVYFYERSRQRDK